MKKLLFFASVLLASITLTISCSKENEVLEPVNISEEAEIIPIDTIQTEANINYHYYFDEDSVQEGTFSLEDENLIISVYVINELEHEIHAFTTKELYFSWGEKMNLPTQLEFEVVDHLRNYAQENGYIDYYKQTGKVHENYIIYEQNYYERMVGSKSQRGIYMMLYKSYSINQTTGQISLNGGAWPFLSTYPYMPLGWNDETSGFFQFNVFGGLVMFDKPFYFKRLGSFWIPAWKSVALTGPYSFYDNKMSSGIGF